MKLIASSKKQKRLANAEELKQSTLSASHQLQNDDGADIYTSLNQIFSQVTTLISNDQKLQPTSQSLEEAFTIISECAVDLRNYADSIEIAPEELIQTEDRLSAIDQIARKHKVSAEDIINVHKKLSDELSQLTQPEYDLDSLRESLQIVEQEYITLAKKISKRRRSVADTLSKEITQALAKLGMDKARVEISVNYDESSTFTSFGLDSVILNAQTNPWSKIITPFSSCIWGRIVPHQPCHTNDSSR